MTAMTVITEDIFGAVSDQIFGVWFLIGTVVFILIGFGLLLGEDVVGLIGKPGF